MALELSLEEHQELAIIALDGNVRTSNANLLQDTIDMLVDDGHSRIILDCKGLISMNSDGLAVLSDLVKHMRGRGRLVLCRVNKPVQDLLHISGLDLFIESESSKDAAIRRILH
ncbi:STAS domain-containing protein [Sansalvadorimonas verongulae]|uniref:STAS domain-containing protein n=1 Tax=Sansalvadorimonas verongulae TaxID=2172824 RepID=UPI0012BD2DFC|nr:STAS domain-containing protein [Sansalvadorimonas verongulae]MTI14809.1 anti-sigma factor antagonist [Sansalvadorimonas verongulae]